MEDNAPVIIKTRKSSSQWAVVRTIAGLLAAKVSNKVLDRKPQHAAILAGPLESEATCNGFIAFHNLKK